MRLNLEQAVVRTCPCWWDLLGNRCSRSWGGSCLRSLGGGGWWLSSWNHKILNLSYWWTRGLGEQIYFFLALYWFLIYQFFLFNNLNFYNFYSFFNMLFLYIHSYIGIYQQKLTFFLTLSLRVALFHLLVSSRRWSFEVQNLIKILKYCNINILTSQFCGFFKTLSRLKFISLCCIFLYLNWKGKQMKLTSKFHTYTCR